VPLQSSDQFLKDIRRRQALPPVTLFIGDEDSLIEECLRAFEARFWELAGGPAAGPVDFNREVHAASRGDWSSVLEALGTLPFGCPKKLVILTGFEKAKADYAERIERYVSSPNPSSCLALLWNVRPTQAAMGRGLVPAVSASGTAVRCWKLDREDSRVEWIRRRAEGLGLELAPEAARLLSQEGGESLRELGTELEKLYLLSGGKRRVTAADAAESMSFRRGKNLWDVARAMDAGKFREAGRILEHCLAQGEEPAKVMAFLSKSVRNAAQRSRSGGKILEELADADLRLKSGHGPESAVFERLVALSGD